MVVRGVVTEGVKYSGTTNSAFATIGSNQTDVSRAANVLIKVIATGSANALEYRLAVSDDALKWWTIVGPSGIIPIRHVPARTVDYQTLTDTWNYVDVNPRARLSGSNTAFTVIIKAKG